MPRNRSLPPHLEIRRAGYFWRRRLPRTLRDRGEVLSDRPEKEDATRPKKVFLCFSLRIQILRDAKILAHRLTEMSDLVFAADAETMMAIAPEIQVRMLESLARFEIEAFERARSVAAPRSPDAAALDLRREEALQMTLREALYLGDREVARRPLHHVAARLGIELDESGEDWRAMAYEATKVLLDISQERSRRQQGIYEQQTLVFRRALSTSPTVSARERTTQAALPATPAAFASEAAYAGDAAPAAPSVLASAPVSLATEMPDTLPEASPATDKTSGSAPHQDAATPEASSTVMLSLSPVIVPAGFDLPGGYDEESWQKARVAARPPRILVDRKLLSDGSRAALEKQRGMTVTQAIELYFELLSWGYRAPFNKHQKRKGVPEKLKTASVEERLSIPSSGNPRRIRYEYPCAAGFHSGSNGRRQR